MTTSFSALLFFGTPEEREPSPVGLFLAVGSFDLPFVEPCVKFIAHSPQLSPVLLCFPQRSRSGLRTTSEWKSISRSSVLLCQCCILGLCFLPAADCIHLRLRIEPHTPLRRNVWQGLILMFPVVFDCLFSSFLLVIPGAGIILMVMQ